MEQPLEIHEGHTTNLVTARSRVDVLGKHLHVLDRCGRQDAVTEIENVANAAGDASQYVVGLREHALHRAEQEGRIEIALDRAVVSDPLPRDVERDPPVHADDVAARCTELFEDG